jgi:hypothetical protein
MMEAVNQYQNGLDLLNGLPDGIGHQQQELDLLIALGRALMGAKRMASATVVETYARARVLADQLE